MIEKDKFGLSILDSLVQVADGEIKRIQRLQRRQSLPENLKIRDDKGNLSYDNPINATFDNGLIFEKKLKG